MNITLSLSKPSNSLYFQEIRRFVKRELLYERTMFDPCVSIYMLYVRTPAIPFMQ